MYLFDSDFSSCLHAPLIGVTGIAVALCDALFSQILSQTRDLPYLFGKTPAEVDLYVEKLNRYHKRTFWAWVLSKCSSAAAIITPAVLLAAKSGERVYSCRTELYIAGYLAMGVSIASAAYFLQTYFTARKSELKAKRIEIVRHYEETHPEPSPELKAAIECQRQETYGGFGATKRTASRVK